MRDSGDQHGRSLIYEVRYTKSSDELGAFPGYIDAHRDESDATEHARRMNERAQRMNLDAVYFTEVRDVTGAWVPPVQRLPRDRFQQVYSHEKTGEHTWDVTHVVVNDVDEGIAAAAYQRGYPGQPPFEPFRQRGADGVDRHYALISRYYQGTDVVALDGDRGGEVIAAEDRDEARNGARNGYGFCPVGFYVPDWWDVHDGSIIPGSHYWEDQHDRWPDGTLGFVWGCYWGDDNGWKVQALDLSRISEGIIARDDRYGYTELATLPGDASQFIRVHQGERGSGPVVTFAVPHTYNAVTGARTGEC